MRTYGRLGRAERSVFLRKACVANFSDEEAVSESLSSDERYETITPKTSIDVRVESDDLKPSQDTCVPEYPKAPVQFELLDFLDQPPCKKRRRTRQARPDATGDDIDCDSQETFFSSQAEKSFQSTIDDANSVLLQLGGPLQGPKTELAALDTDPVVSGSQNWPGADLASKKLYGKTRTIVQHADDDDDVLPDAEDGSSDTVECSQSTQHFNHLRAMGETLKYQDDLEFTLQVSLRSNLDTRISSVLGLALNLLNDAGFLDYAVKHCQKEVWEWCLRLLLDSNVLLLHAGAFVLYKLALKPDHSLWGEMDFPTVIFPLIQQTQVATTDDCTEHVKGSYDEFLLLTNRKPGLFYGLKLWNHCLDREESLDEGAIDAILEVLEKDCCHTPDALAIAEKVLSKKGTDNDVSQSRWFKALSQYCSSQATNHSLIKALVKITNDEIEVYDGMSDVFRCSLTFILVNSALLFQNTREDLIDVFVLHLGLCLNLVRIQSLMHQVSEDEVQKTHEVLQQLLRSSDKTLLRDFNQNMYVLICCYFACSGVLTFQPAETKIVRHRLNAFAKEIEPFNKSIHGNVLQMLDAISV
ncbi:LAME_0F05314g1_1 [Lachancea meyersii CBS 8951]|uniref:LAME_0F05314g1_1 n=1 Tax=Lachancea meyersii CBS 8951 TaxID=1266667 RepID=A0A1G4JT38_9SACH|nr:LAME_0F05314g1_1 [Lachancea meyersii CBS 8951]